MATKLWNWRLWVGFGLSLIALLAYVGYVLLLSLTRSLFWPSLILFVVAAVFLISGLKRASREPQIYRGKILGPILATLSVVVFALFAFASYQIFRNFPEASKAPKVGQRAPEFALVDTNGKNFSLAQLLSAPIADSNGAARPAKGVLVFFYRGYW